MGCDIHVNVERHLKDGSWQLLTLENPFIEYKRTVTDEDGNTHEERWHPQVEAYNDRCYELFGILAGVRSTALHQVDDDLRGFPVDASDELRKIYEGWKGGCHSTTWYLLSELKAFAANDANFFSDKSNWGEEDEPWRESVEEEERDSKACFKDFVNSIRWFVTALTIYTPPHNVRVTMWFDS